MNELTYTEVETVHGFRVSDGGIRTPDVFAPELTRMGYNVDTKGSDYGRHGLIRTRLAPKETIKKIAESLESAEIIITHSNGANYVHRALKLLGPEHYRTKFIFHFSPALDCDFEVPDAARRIWVFCTKHDWAVRWSALRFWHDWGAAGAYGYRGCRTDIVKTMRFDEAANSHSDWFRGHGPWNWPAWIHDLMIPYHLADQAA